MKKLFLLLFVGLSLQANQIELSQAQANFIAKKVWQNEGAGKDKYLIWWNKGEDFASLGIGHFIWFPKGHTEKFREVFPMVLVAYMQEQGVTLPQGITPQSPFPWQSKEAFFWAKKTNSKYYQRLFTFLKRTQSYQAMFMAQRLQNALPQMLATLHTNKEKARIQKRFEYMLYKGGKIDERGLYILLDYTNFKGEGTLKSERYHNQGWGLLQVLEHLDTHQPQI